MSHVEILGVMVLAGLIGGTVNFALARTEHSGWPDWFWSVVVGIGASLLVPLFLNTISSTLLSGLLTKTAPDADIFVFAGFCLLGAIASKAMIQTLTQKWLKQAEVLSQEVKTLKEEVAPIVEKETETESSPTRAAETQRGLELPEHLSQVLNALGSSQFALRSVTGLAHDVERPSNDVVTSLQELSRMGLAAEVQGKKGIRWTLTPSGRNQLSA